MKTIGLFFVGERWVKGSPYLEECDCCHDVFPLRAVEFPQFHCPKCRECDEGAHGTHSPNCRACAAKDSLAQSSGACDTPP